MGLSIITWFMLLFGFVIAKWIFLKIFLLASAISILFNIRYIVNISNVNMMYYIAHSNYILCLIGTILGLMKPMSGYLALYFLWSEIYHIAGICKVLYVWIQSIRVEYQSFMNI